MNKTKKSVYEPLHQNVHQKTSALLRELPQHPDFKKLTPGTLVDLLDHRAYGIGMLIFALPNILPFAVIPGVSAMFSLPILFLSVQLMLLRKHPWLPRRIRTKQLNTDAIATFIHRAMPYLEKAEKMVKPRLSFFSSAFFIPAVGFTLLYLCFLLMLPIPLSNMVFGGLIALMAIGLVENDGLLLSCGVLISPFIVACYTKTLVYLWTTLF